MNRQEVGGGGTMKRLLVILGLLPSMAAWPGDPYWPGDNARQAREMSGSLPYQTPTEPSYSGMTAGMAGQAQGNPGDPLDQEIARLEQEISVVTPDATGRYGEVTARFGPQWSPYFQSQMLRLPGGMRKMPAPDSPEAQALLAELAGRALVRHYALVRKRLLALYELRALRKLADDGVPPALLEAELARAVAPAQTAQTPPASEPALGDAGPAVKVATYRNPTGFVVAKDRGSQVLESLTFTPDSPRNTVLMVSLEATLQRAGDSQATTTLRLENEMAAPPEKSHKALDPPALRLLPDDPNVARKADSTFYSGPRAARDAGLRDQPRYRFYLTAPEGAPAGDVEVSHILIRIYYVTARFIEAGTIQ